MSSSEFRFYFYTPRYEETVRFYKDELEFAIFRQWDRTAEDRGTIFHSPNHKGFIEVEFGAVTPAIAGGFYIEVEDLESRYDRLLQRGVIPHKEIGITSYGHRNFKVLDPNGIEVAFFEYV